MFALFSSTPNREDIVLLGERVLLRPLAARDADEMFVFASDPEVTKYLPWEAETNVAMVRGFLQDQVTRRRRGESVGFAVVHRETGVMIGSTDLMELKAVRGQAEIGYLLARSHWNQGLMTEAARLTLGYGFSALNLNRIIAWADEDNRASRRVLEKVGMTLSGSEYRFVKSERRPYVRLEITKTAWRGSDQEGAAGEQG
jgi:ribosomal-protein-alanine N-acetyltransferase